jgi:hypothetical protein
MSVFLKLAFPALQISKTKPQQIDPPFLYHIDISVQIPDARG